MEKKTTKRRAFALLIDLLVFSLLILLINYFCNTDDLNYALSTFFSHFKNKTFNYYCLIELLSNLSTLSNLLLFGLALFAYILYFILFVILTNGRTIGKYLFRLKTIKINESRMSFGSLFIREVLSTLILTIFTFGIYALINFISMLVSKGDRTLSDRLSNTLVILDPYRIKRGR